jgi:hypothetical protein
MRNGSAGGEACVRRGAFFRDFLTQPAWGREIGHSVPERSVAWKRNQIREAASGWGRAPRAEPPVEPRAVVLPLSRRSLPGEGGRGVGDAGTPLAPSTVAAARARSAAPPHNSFSRNRLRNRWAMGEDAARRAGRVAFRCSPLRRATEGAAQPVRKSRRKRVPYSCASRAGEEKGTTQRSAARRSSAGPRAPNARPPATG